DRLNKKKESSLPPYFMSLEPPDGDGFCQCANCNSVSDQIYGLANEVAEFLYLKDTNAYITMYGYNAHAGVPTFQIHKNVIIGIVPYAFQSVGSPEAMMKEWESTGAKLYLRDYLAIPNWGSDKPTYDPKNNFLNKIQHLKEVEYIGYYFETTASFMA